ncbi:MAG: hypothetical protein ACREH4_00670, partial [Vitreimonas sp.]
MSLLRFAVFAAALLACSGAAAQVSPQAPLQRFGSAEAFDAFVAEVAEEQRRREERDWDVIVLAHPPTPPPRSLTDVTIGVDSGDIAKRVGQFLVVLWDGALFSVDLRPAGAPGLRRAARLELDRERFNEDTNIIASGDRVIAYDHTVGGASFLVLGVGADGALTAEAEFRIVVDAHSRAYLADGRLVFVTQIGLVRAREPIVWPRLVQGERQEQLIGPEDVYRPILAAHSPYLHATSVCALDASAHVRCATTGVVGPGFPWDFVTAAGVYHWFDDVDPPYLPERCDFARARDGDSSALLRVALDGGAPSAVSTRGSLPSFWRHADGSVHALVAWCRSRSADLRHVVVPSGGDSMRPTYRRVPRHANGGFAFVQGEYLVSAASGAQLFDVRELRGSRATTVRFTPLDHGETAEVRLAHDIRAVEFAGEDIIFMGNRDGGGLSLSRVRVDRAPRLASRITLQGRYLAMRWERAYSSITDASGAGYLALPTWRRAAYGEREADMTFVALT